MVAVQVCRCLLVAGHGGTTVLLCGVPAVSGHGEVGRSALQNHNDHATMSRRLRRLEVLRQSMATAAAMAALRRRRTHDGAKRKVAYQRRDCGRCKVGKVEKGEEEL